MASYWHAAVGSFVVPHLFFVAMWAATQGIITLAGIEPTTTADECADYLGPGEHQACEWWGSQSLSAWWVCVLVFSISAWRIRARRRTQGATS